MSKSNLVPWFEWTGTKDGLVHAMTVEDFHIWNVLWPGEIQVKDRVATRSWVGAGKHHKAWELSQYVTNSLQSGGTEADSERGEAAEAVDLLSAKTIA